jgi:hypothetical protein
MIRSSVLLLLAPLATGCIFYDGTCGKGHGRCTTKEDTAGLTEGGGDDTGDSGAGDSGDVAAPVALFFADPSELVAGSTTIVSLTAENFDLSLVDSVEAFGPIELLATSKRTDELLLTVSVDAEAAAGQTADLLLSMGDEGEYLDDVFTVLASEGGTGGTDTGDCD